MTKKSSDRFTLAALELPEPEFESQGVDPIEVVPEQPFVADEPEVLIQLKSRFVCDFCLQNNLVSVVKDHCIYCFLHQGGPNFALPEVLVDSEHSDVATLGNLLVVVEFTNNGTYTAPSFIARKQRFGQL